MCTRSKAFSICMYAPVPPYYFNHKLKPAGGLETSHCHHELIIPTRLKYTRLIIAVSKQIYIWMQGHIGTNQWKKAKACLSHAIWRTNSPQERYSLKSQL